MKKTNNAVIPFCEDDLHVCYSYVSNKKGRVDIYFKLDRNRALESITEGQIPDPDNPGKFILVITVKLKAAFGMPLYKGWNHIPWLFLLKDEETGVTVNIDKPGTGGPGSKGPTSTYPRA